MWRPVRHDPGRTRPGNLSGRRAELIGGPLDGLTVGEPLEPYAQFILVPADGSSGGPYPIHTYIYGPSTNRYRYAGCGVQAPPAW